jgi:hypothetical protein
MKSALSIGALNFLFYLCWVYNYRAVAQARYADAIVSDMLIAALSFSIIRKAATANTFVERAAFVLGGGLASFCGIFITKVVFGQ